MNFQRGEGALASSFFFRGKGDCIVENLYTVEMCCSFSYIHIESTSKMEAISRIETEDLCWDYMEYLSVKVKKQSYKNNVKNKLSNKNLIKFSSIQLPKEIILNREIKQKLLKEISEKSKYYTVEKCIMFFYKGIMAESEHEAAELACDTKPSDEKTLSIKVIKEPWAKNDARIDEILGANML